MSALIAGTAGGLLVASVFVFAGVLMLFSFVKDPPPHLAAAAALFSSPSLVLWVVILAYPTWGVIGAVMGLAYLGVNELNPGPGLGSPNLVFTLVMTVTAIALGLLMFLLLKRMVAGVLAISLAFAGVFGWFLPHFAA